MHARLPDLHRRRALGAGRALHRRGRERGGASERRRRPLGLRFRAQRAARRGRRLGTGRARRARTKLCCALPAVQRAGGGQGGGGHGVLPLLSAQCAQRGGRRARPVRHRGRGLPCGERRPRAALAAHDARNLDTRQQALGRRAPPHRRAVRNARGMDAGARALARPVPQCAKQAGQRRGAVARRRVPAVPDAAGHLARGRPRRRHRAGLQRSHLAVHAEGRA
ncbi:hypothetical protein D9M72_433140 [compost metagenome]